MTPQAQVSTSPRGLFITGTDTGVGKTHLTCLIARELLAAGIRTAAYKPVCSGAVARSVQTLHSLDLNSEAQPETDLVWDDIERLREATERVWSDELICPQRFFAPVAPPVAARMEGRTVDFQLAVAGAYRFTGAEVVLVEGAGGWLSPISQTGTVAELAVQLRLPVLIVSRRGLGTINHTLLTIESVRARGLHVAGVILNEATSAGGDLSCQTNAEEIAQRGQVDVLGEVTYQPVEKQGQAPRMVSDSSAFLISDGASSRFSTDCYGMKSELQRGGHPVTIRWQEIAGPLIAQPTAGFA